jgi:hypothetical protein
MPVMRPAAVEGFLLLPEVALRAAFLKSIETEDNSQNKAVDLALSLLSSALKCLSRR